jgi:hypothetical protein
LYLEAKTEARINPLDSIPAKTSISFGWKYFENSSAIKDNADGSFKIGLKSLNKMPFLGKFGCSDILSWKIWML